MLYGRQISSEHDDRDGGKPLREAREAKTARDFLIIRLTAHASSLEKATRLLHTVISEEKVAEALEKELSVAINGLPTSDQVLEDYRSYKTARDAAAALSSQVRELVADLL